MKQVICVRKDLNMRKGKMIAQGSHASLMAYMNAMHNGAHVSQVFDWLQNYAMTKICVGVESEEQLFLIYNQAKNKNLPCSLVLDAAKTEFKEPTHTCCAIGPASEEEIDAITGNLKLL
jgi:PTH2 family peptidyl-tRNA hydrolase